VICSKIETVDSNKQNVVFDKHLWCFTIGKPFIQWKYGIFLYQLQEELDQGIGMSNAGVTLRRLVVWTFDPLIRLKSLAAMVDVCKGTGKL
jgi:hypothetical protein